MDDSDEIHPVTFHRMKHDEKIRRDKKMRRVKVKKNKSQSGGKENKTGGKENKTLEKVPHIKETEPESIDTVIRKTDEQLVLARISAVKVNLLGKHPEDDLETKPILKKRKKKPEEKETTKELIERRVELSETMSDEANLISVETVEGLDEAPDFVKEPKKTVYVGGLSYEAEISDIIDFFKDVGQVVRVRIMVTRTGKRLGHAFVEFASADEATKALEKKNGEYLLDRQIFLDVFNKGTTYIPPK